MKILENSPDLDSIEKIEKTKMENDPFYDNFDSRFNDGGADNYMCPMISAETCFNL
jgi:hypothetical protein